MLIGFLLALSILVLGSNLNPFNFNESLGVIDRLQIAILWCLVPILFLTVSIGRLARHRFFTPQDIDGSGLTEGLNKQSCYKRLFKTR